MKFCKFEFNMFKGEKIKIAHVNFELQKYLLLRLISVY